MTQANRHPDTRDVFFRNTAKDGSSYVSQHWAWDVDRITSATEQRAKDAGGTAERITKEQYLKERAA